MKRTFFLAALSLAVSAGLAGAQTWKPEKPIEIVVGFAPGGGSDQAARTIAAAAQDLFPVPLVVNNKPGAGGVLAASQVAKAEGDGYTLLVAGGSDTTSVPAHRQVPYEPSKDFKSIIRLTNNPYFVVVKKDSPYKTIEDLIAAAKEKPGQISIGNSGVGTLAHSISLIIERAADVTLKHVPYQGGAPGLQALVAGQIDVTLGATEEIEGQVKSDTIRVLAATSAERSKYYPEVPTLQEKGLNAVVTNMKGLVAPANLPQEIADYLHEQFHKAMENTVWKNFADRVGEPTNYQNGAAFQASQTAQLERIREALKK